MDQHCEKCGATLPDLTEGICPTCGTPFGSKTMAMEITPEMLAQIASAREAAQRPQGGVAPAPMQPPQLPPLSEPPNRIPWALLIGLALVASGLLTAVIYVAYLRP